MGLGLTVARLGSVINDWVGGHSCGRHSNPMLASFEHVTVAQSSMFLLVSFTLTLSVSILTSFSPRVLNRKGYPAFPLVLEAALLSHTTWLHVSGDARYLSDGGARVAASAGASICTVVRSRSPYNSEISCRESGTG